MSINEITHRQIKISSDHPSLSGHFPSNPVLPGVVILDHVRRCIEEWKHYSIDDSQLKSVKFLSPVLISDETPQSLDIVLEEKKTLSTDARTKIDFRCLQNENLIAQGLWLLQADQSQ
jgi:3-hydroxymyristoyl/3-hydroxydecanoyl-(acyl carrier protein) dehydratase